MSVQQMVPETELAFLIRGLSNPDITVRRQARRGLLAVGEPAVPALTQLLRHPDVNFRWEVAKTLVEMANPTSAEALANLLRDNDFGIRWLAAEGLIALGRRGLRAALQALIDNPDSPSVRAGVSHVVRFLASEGMDDLLAPVVKALEGFHPPVNVELKAHEALKRLDREAA